MPTERHPAGNRAVYVVASAPGGERLMAQTWRDIETRGLVLMKAHTADEIVDAARLVSAGRIYRLAKPRFPGMPLGDGHPDFQVLTYRSPHGLKVAEDKFLAHGNDVGYSYLTELMIGTAHSGAHIDALAHVTLGPECRWHGGAAGKDLGDFGPQKGDASEIGPIWCRGVLFDVAGHRGVECLPAEAAITWQELADIGSSAGFTVEPGDVALVRTGFGSVWPDPGAMEAHVGAGPDLGAARWLSGQGVVATGSDTVAYEVHPPAASDGPQNPMPVHSHLLIEAGIHIMELLDLEELARDGVTEFLFVALPLAVRGATASMIDPIAVV